MTTPPTPEQVAELIDWLRGWDSPKSLKFARTVEALHADNARLREAGGRYTKCCVCGRCVDTFEEDEGGDEHGCQILAGMWVCSPECENVYIPQDAPGDAREGASRD